MDYLPLFVDLRNRPVLVVGGGEQAAQKVRLLLKAQAAVLILANDALPELRDLAQSGSITLEARAFARADVLGKAAVFSASGDDAVDATVAASAKAANVPVNVVDDAALSSFIIPAIVDRDPVIVAISSAGTAPILARSLRARIEAMLPARLGELAKFAASFRKNVRALLPTPQARRRFWEQFFDGAVAETVMAGDEPAARSEMLQLLNRSSESERGIVYLVGAGPGDPDLLTVRALRLMEQADVVLYDELVGDEILDRVRRDAERIYVGKSKGRHSTAQAQINALLLREASAGKRVLRIKGGDPFVFGRGGEEMEFLHRHGIEVVAVPGITAALGGLAYAGIPLTHRDHAQSVTFVTGHTRSGEDAVDWSAIAAKSGHTLVVYMGLTKAQSIAERLLGLGLDEQTPVAIVQNGTRANQRVVVGRLRDFGRLAESLVGQGPALLIVGSVVRLADAWQQQELGKVASWQK
jgi:uroporphyrin-III C-methyltransferase / precorrin-2 dehydrogenase / sirohydrochlorin ferrochelatase